MEITFGFNSERRFISPFFDNPFQCLSELFLLNNTRFCKNPIIDGDTHTRKKLLFGKIFAIYEFSYYRIHHFSSCLTGFVLNECLLCHNNHIVGILFSRKTVGKLRSFV